MHPPTISSYWVIPGKLLAGRTPVGDDELATRSNVENLVEGGISHFIDLTEPGELPPYAGLVHKVAASRKISATCESFPIPDFGTVPPEDMRVRLDAIDTALKKGGVVYLHCWGGKGRTGTVVGCFLVRHGMTGEDALKEIERLRADLPDAGAPSPETGAQRNMVLSWKDF